MSNIWANLLTILVGGLLVNNFVMNRFLGCCPFLGVSKQYDTAKGMSMAVIFVMTLASFITWFVQHLILVPLHLEYMQTIAFILVIAVLVGIVEMALKKISPSLYQSLGVYLPLITTNCAVLGVAILNVDNGYNLLESTFNGGGLRSGDDSLLLHPRASCAGEHAQVDERLPRRADYGGSDGDCVYGLRRLNRLRREDG